MTDRMTSPQCIFFTNCLSAFYVLMVNEPKTNSDTLNKLRKAQYLQSVDLLKTFI